jgi:hypothetical protein
MPVSPARKTTLEKIEDKIAHCRVIIANKRAEIKELEIAAAIIRQVEGVSAEQSFVGKKIRECLLILLKEIGEPAHFEKLTKEAVARGYQSQKGGDMEIIAKSFQSVLRAFPKDFERTGPGVFQLKKKESPT